MYANNRKGAQPFNNHDKAVVKDKQSRLKYNISGNLFIVVAILNLIIGFFLFIYLVIHLRNDELAIGSLMLLTSLTIITHEDRVELMNRILPLMMNGIILIMIGYGVTWYLVFLSLATPILFLLNNRSKKHFLFPATLLTIALGFGLYFTKLPPLVFHYLIILYLIYYKTRHKTPPKATYYNDISPYQQRRNKEAKQYNSDF